MVARKKKITSGAKAAANFPGAFAGLRAILQPYEAKLRAKNDTKDSHYLERPSPNSRDKPFFFVAAKIDKNYDGRRRPETPFTEIPLEPGPLALCDMLM